MAGCGQIAVSRSCIEMDEQPIAPLPRMRSAIDSLIRGIKLAASYRKSRSPSSPESAGRRPLYKRRHGLGIGRPYCGLRYFGAAYRRIRGHFFNDSRQQAECRPSESRPHQIRCPSPLPASWPAGGHDVASCGARLVGSALAPARLVSRGGRAWRGCWFTRRSIPSAIPA